MLTMNHPFCVYCENLPSHRMNMQYLHKKDRKRMWRNEKYYFVTICILHCEQYFVRFSLELVCRRFFFHPGSVWRSKLKIVSVPKHAHNKSIKSSGTTAIIFEKNCHNMAQKTHSSLLSLFFLARFSSLLRKSNHIHTFPHTCYIRRDTETWEGKTVSPFLQIDMNSFNLNL